MQISEFQSSGALWAFAIKDGRASVLKEGDLPAALAEEGVWVWAHFGLSDNRARRFIERLELVIEPARAMLTGVEQRVQIHIAGPWAYGVLPEFEKEFDGHTIGSGRLLFAVGERCLITARRHALQGVDEVRRELAAGAGAPATPSMLLGDLIERFAHLAHGRLDALSDDLDHIEDQVLAEKANLDRVRLGPIRRELSLYHREFQGLRSAMHRASGGRAAPVCALTQEFPLLLQRIEDFDRDAAGLQDRARLLYEEIEARIASLTNRSLRALTIFTTLLMPPTLIVGAFGMNLEGIPWAQDRAGFAWALGLSVVIVALCYGLLRRLRIFS